VTSQPNLATSAATASPDGPEPTTATFAELALELRRLGPARPRVVADEALEPDMSEFKGMNQTFLYL